MTVTGSIYERTDKINVNHEQTYVSISSDSQNKNQITDWTNR